MGAKKEKRGMAKLSTLCPEKRRRYNGPATGGMGSATGVAPLLALIYISIVYLGGQLQVSKWGNSLAVRLPSALVAALGLKEGDEIEIRIEQFPFF